MGHRRRGQDQDCDGDLDCPVRRIAWFDSAKLKHCTDKTSPFAVRPAASCQSFRCRAAARETSAERCFGRTLPAAAARAPRRCNGCNSWTWSSHYFCRKLRKSGLFWPMVRQVPPDPLLLFLTGTALAFGFSARAFFSCSHIAGRRHVRGAQYLQEPQRCHRFSVTCVRSAISLRDCL